MHNILIIIFLNLFLLYFFSFFAKKFNLVDLPDHRKLHTGEIPLLGGFCTYLSIIVISFYYNFSYEVNLILYSSGIILFLGLIDDSKQIGVTIRLTAQIITCLVVINGGLSIVDLGEYHTFEPFNLGILGFLLTCLAILALTNGINFIDGIDGLASGLIIISLFSIYIYSYFEGNLNDIEIVIFLLTSIFSKNFKFTEVRLLIMDTSLRFRKLLNNVCCRGSYSVKVVVRF